MRKLLTICAILLSLSASAQWQLTGSRVRYVNGIGIPTRDTSAMTPADSSQILIRPADSSLYVRYKRTWMRVGGGGGSIAGSGTTNYIPKFTSSTAIGNSQIFDNGTNVGIGTTSPSERLTVTGNGTFSGSLTTGGLLTTNNRLWISSNNPISDWISSSLTAGYSATNSYGWLNSANNLLLGTDGTERMRITSSGNVGIGTASPGYKLDLRNDVPASTSLEPISFGLYNNNDGGSAIYFRNSVNGQSKIAFGVESTGAGTNDTYLGFSTGVDASLNERMRITSSGNVGIGTTSPATDLQISRAGSSTLRLTNTSNTTNVELGIATALGFVGTQTDNSFAINTNNTERMRITNTGNVGIGYTSPAARLAVNGRTLINTNTDNGVDALQVSGSMNVSALATTNNLSVTTNATVGGTLRVTGTTTLGTTNTGPITASSIDAGTGNGSFGNVYSGGIVQMLGVNVKYRNISATYTATTSDDYFINITSGTFTLNLPTAATPYGQVYVIKNSGTGTVTVDPNGSQTIDGATTFTMNVQNGSITIIGDGSNWKIVSKYL